MQQAHGQHRIRRVALTGGIASGKSLVGEALQKRGVPTIDADHIVHDLLRDDAELKAQIRQAFGEGVFHADGTVDRPALGSVVFSDTEKRKRLESWIHPKTRDAIERFYKEHANAPLGVSIIPLLFESKLADRYDEVWLLESDEAQQLARLVEKRGMTPEHAAARIQNQMPLEEKRRLTQLLPHHAILNNRGTPETLLAQLDALLNR